MKFVPNFIQSAGALLLAAAWVSWLGGLAALGHLQPHDALLGVSMPVLLWAFGGVALAIAWFCLFGRNTLLQLGVVLWLAGNLCAYQIGVRWQNPSGFSAYLLDVAVAIGVSPHVVDLMLQSITLYLLSGSIYCLVQLRLREPVCGPTEAVDFEIIACPACGVHLKFNHRNLNQSIPCPQCHASIVLRKPDLLKMACFFCKGHIEFPSHAIGQKLKCPHCNKDITLKQP